MTQIPARAPDAGVTLVEMLVSLVLTALIGIAGFAMLDTILRVSNRAEDDLDRLSALDRAFLVISRDAAMADPARLGLGPDRLDLGETAYVLSDGTLRREVSETDVTQTLLEGIGSAGWQVIAEGGAAFDAWPVEGAAPAALSLSLGFEIGEVQRLFALPDGLAP